MRRLALLLALVPSLASAAELPPMPLHFIRNVGETDPAVSFLVKGRGPDLYFATDEYVFAEPPTSCGPGAVVRVRFEGARTPLVPEALETLPGVANFYLGNDPALWREGVPMHAGVAYREAWPGIDAIYRGTEGRLKGEFVVAPGADPSRIVLSFAGVTSLSLREDGALVLRTETGALTEEAPVAWEERGSARREVRARFVVLGADRVGFAVEGRDPLARLVIDPVLDYASCVGGSEGDAGATAFGQSWSGGLHQASCAGSTRSPDFPSPLGAPPSPGSWDAWFARVDLEAATIQWMTFVGGSGDDFGLASGGTTFSPDLPVTSNAPDRTYGGEGDGFFAGFNDAGTLLVLTYFGGSRREEVLAAGRCLGGRTWSTDFRPISGSASPAAPPADTRMDGPSDGFITCAWRDGAGEGITTSFVGGSGDDAVTSLGAHANNGSQIAGGWTRSPDFPTTATALQTTLSGASDAFLVLYSQANGGVTAATLFGGAGDESADSVSMFPLDLVYRIDTSFVLAAGRTDSPDFPLESAFQSASAGGLDAWCAVLTVDLGTFALSSYFGGEGDDSATGLSSRPDGRFTVAGTTSSRMFPLVRPIQPSLRGTTDAFVALVNPFSSPPRLEWSTYIGGSGDDSVSGASPSADDCTLFTGTTTSADFPVRRAIQPLPGGGEDGFVARICETDVLGRLDPADAMTQIIERLERIESQLDLGDVRDALARIDSCCATANGKLDDVLARSDDVLARLDAIQAALDALAAASRGELLRDIETSLFRRECVPWLWLPESAGSLRLALDHLEQRIADAEASGDPRPNIRIARDRLASARSEADAGRYEDACKRLTETLHALTTP